MSNRSLPGGACDVRAAHRRYSLAGFPRAYDQYRPKPPLVILDILTQMARAPRAKAVVDLGSGTGLSTRIWANRAELVIGIEPNTEMRQWAEKRNRRFAGWSRIQYQEGTSTRTNQRNGCADIVTCAQSFHWMEPASTLAEIARILRGGGVFAAYDYLWPPTMDWEVEAAFHSMMPKARAIWHAKNFDKGMTWWPKEDRLALFQASGHFAYVREVLIHHKVKGNANRLVGLVRSRGPIFTLLQHGYSEEEIGLDELRSVAESLWGEREVPWYFSYRLCVGVRCR